MEVAGLVIGVVPLVLAVIEQYGKLYKCCKRFRKCKTGGENLTECLKVQEIIFVSETRLLLAIAFGANQAKAMVTDHKHPAWSAQSSEHHLSTVLGDSKDAMQITVRDIELQMKQLREEIEALEVDPGKCDARQHRKALRRRFKYAFSESRLDLLCTSLRQKTKQYRLLRSQLQEFTTCQATHDNDHQNFQAVEEVKTTRAAAKHLYEALATACKLHTKHHAHFSLSPVQHAGTVGSSVQFQIAYRHLSTPTPHAHGSRDVLWFVAETTLNGPVLTTEPSIPPRIDDGRMRGHHKRQHSGSLATDGILSLTRNCAKRVRFRSRSPDASISKVSMPSVATPQVEPTIQNDFCTQLRSVCNKGQSAGSCIGWLEDKTPCKHRILHSLGPQTVTSSISPQAASLASYLALSGSSSQAISFLSVVQRLHLARMLAEAVLSLHGTPWMQSTWNSQDIILYRACDAPNSSPSSMASDVFVEVPVRPDQEADAQSTDPLDVLVPFVHNAVLFSLGVMLLEISFGKPLASMHCATDFRHGMPDGMANLYTAFRQCKENPSVMGVKYSKIVEKCLRCDFGQGADLNHPGLQHAFHRDIVSELDRLENGLRHLGMD